jgi:hypothetical protein
MSVRNRRGRSRILATASNGKVAAMQWNNRMKRAERDAETKLAHKRRMQQQAEHVEGE